MFLRGCFFFCEEKEYLGNKHLVGLIGSQSPQKEEQQQKKKKTKAETRMEN